VSSLQGFDIVVVCCGQRKVGGFRLSFARPMSCEGQSPLVRYYIHLFSVFGFHFTVRFSNSKPRKNKIN
jgi:hypothetical protein